MEGVRKLFGFQTEPGPFFTNFENKVNHPITFPRPISCMFPCIKLFYVWGGWSGPAACPIWDGIQVPPGFWHVIPTFPPAAVCTAHQGTETHRECRELGQAFLNFCLGIDIPFISCSYSLCSLGFSCLFLAPKQTRFDCKRSPTKSNSIDDGSFSNRTRED